MEEKQITGLSIDDKIIKIIFSEIKNLNEFTTLLLNEMETNNINFRMFNQNKDTISFIINIDDLVEMEKFINNLNHPINLKYVKDVDLSCLTIVGLGFTSSPTLSIAIINLLAKNDITIEQSSATNLSFSLLINKNICKKAIDLIIEKFNV